MNKKYIYIVFFNLSVTFKNVWVWFSKKLWQQSPFGTIGTILGWGNTEITLPQIKLGFYMLKAV